ncbi:hypothetical protein, partial [Acinetobacter pittii]
YLGNNSCSLKLISIFFYKAINSILFIFLELFSFTRPIFIIKKKEYLIGVKHSKTTQLLRNA